MLGLVAALLADVCLELSAYTQECVAPCRQHQVLAVLVPPSGFEENKVHVYSCPAYLAHRFQRSVSMPPILETTADNGGGIQNLAHDSTAGFRGAPSKADADVQAAKQPSGAGTQQSGDLPSTYVQGGNPALGKPAPAEYPQGVETHRSF